jgi:hypothetical protein
VALLSTSAEAQSFERPAHPWFFADPSVFVDLRTADAQPRVRLRIDAGPAWVREPGYLSAGASFELHLPDRFAVGAFAQYLDGSSGLGVGALAAIDSRGVPLLSANLGFAWFFLDARVLFSAPIEGWIGLGLRIPLGGIAHRAYFDRRPYQLAIQPPAPRRPATSPTLSPAAPPTSMPHTPASAASSSAASPAATPTASPTATPTTGSPTP